MEEIDLDEYIQSVLIAPTMEPRTAMLTVAAMEPISTIQTLGMVLPLIRARGILAL